VEEKWRVHGLVSEYPAGILIPENNVVPFWWRRNGFRH
jgi:hypothetical protein